MCVCFEGWGGARCNFRDPLECAANADCGAGQVCDAGVCLCSGNFGGEECETCGCGKFGGDTCGAPACDIDTTCSGNGRCVSPHFTMSARYIFIECTQSTHLIVGGDSLQNDLRSHCACSAFYRILSSCAE